MHEFDSLCWCLLFRRVCGPKGHNLFMMCWVSGQETVELNMCKGRNYNGRCAWCGEPFSILARAVQCATDKLWYHSFSARTVKSQAQSCYELHKVRISMRPL